MTNKLKWVFRGVFIRASSYPLVSIPAPTSWSPILARTDNMEHSALS